MRICPLTSSVYRSLFPRAAPRSIYINGSESSERAGRAGSFVAVENAHALACFSRLRGETPAPHAQRGLPEEKVCAWLVLSCAPGDSDARMSIRWGCEAVRGKWRLN